MNGTAYRMQAYDAKVDATQLLADLTAAEATMKSRYLAAITAIAAMELQVKQVCDGAGVSVIEIPFYLAFGREMWKKGTQEISGETLAIEAALQIAKWAARGLTLSVLQAIRTDVFSIAAPIAP